MDHISRFLNDDRLKDDKKGNAAPSIRKMEGGDWYWINRSILKIHGRSLGAAGIAVYNVLASFADARAQTCFPTQSYIANRTNMSRMTVARKIRQMKQMGLIEVYQIKGRWFYRLLDTRQVTKEALAYNVALHPV